MPADPSLQPEDPLPRGIPALEPSLDAAQRCPRRLRRARARHTSRRPSTPCSRAPPPPPPPQSTTASQQQPQPTTSRQQSQEPAQPQQEPTQQRSAAPRERLQDGVRRRLGAWRRIGAPRHVMRWLREGVRAEWLDGPPEPFHHGVTSFTPEEREWLTGERDRCLGTGAWRRATCFDFVSRAFIVTHKGKRRLVIDFRHINLHHVARGCRFESLKRLRRMARRNDWVFSIDLKDAYHHVGIHEDDQDYFTFAIQTADGTEYFSASALSFGWTMSPWYFTQIMKPVVSYFRNPAVARTSLFGQRTPGPRGVSLLFYIYWSQLGPASLYRNYVGLTSRTIKRARTVQAWRVVQSAFPVPQSAGLSR